MSATDLLLAAIAIEAIYDPLEGTEPSEVGELLPEQQSEPFWAPVPAFDFSESYTVKGQGTYTLTLKAQVVKPDVGRPEPTGLYLICATGPFDGIRYPDLSNPPNLLDFEDESIVEGEASAMEAARAFAQAAPFAGRLEPADRSESSRSARAPYARTPAPVYEASDSVQTPLPVEKSKPDFVQHTMYDPDTGESQIAQIQADHDRLDKMGWVHEPPTAQNRLQDLKDAGRFGDTDIVHVNEAEKAMLKAAGGAGTINPGTGLREYYRPEDSETLTNWPEGYEQLDLRHDRTQESLTEAEVQALYAYAPDPGAGYMQPWIFGFAHYVDYQTYTSSNVDLAGLAYIIWTTPTYPREYWAFTVFYRDGTEAGTFWTDETVDLYDMDAPQSILTDLTDWLLADAAIQGATLPGWEGIYLDELGDAGVDAEEMQDRSGEAAETGNSVVDGLANIVGDTPSAREGEVYLEYSNSLPNIMDGTVVTPFTVTPSGFQTSGGTTVSGNDIILQNYGNRFYCQIAEGYRVKFNVLVSLNEDYAIDNEGVYESFTVYLESGDTIEARLWEDTTGFNDFGVPEFSIVLDGDERIDMSSLPVNANWESQQIRFVFSAAYRFEPDPRLLLEEARPGDNLEDLIPKPPEDVQDRQEKGNEEREGDPEENYMNDGNGDSVQSGTGTSPLVWVISGGLVALLVWVVLRTTGRPQ